MAISTNILLSLDVLFCMLSSQKKKTRHDIHKITPTLTFAQHSYQVEESPFCHKVLHIHLAKNYVAAKSNLNNYNDHIDLRKHMQNVRNILELVIIKNESSLQLSIDLLGCDIIVLNLALF